MTLVAFLKGANVGGRRRFRPTIVAKEMAGLGVVNIGAAGTFVVREPIARAELRDELQRRVPFEVEVILCSATELLRLVDSDPFEGQRVGEGLVPFVSVMASRRGFPTELPSDLPGAGEWRLRVLACRDRFVVGLHRREMRAIRLLEQLEQRLGTVLTTRTWNTILRIEKVLRGAVQ